MKIRELLRYFGCETWGEFLCKATVHKWKTIQKGSKYAADINNKSIVECIRCEQKEASYPAGPGEMARGIISQGKYLESSLCMAVIYIPTFILVILVVSSFIVLCDFACQPSHMNIGR